MPNIERLRQDSGGTLPSWAWPGGYPLYYLTEDNGVLCPACANGKNGSMTNEPACQDDPQWKVIAYDVHWEGEPLVCDHCNGQVESAYGPPAD